MAAILITPIVFNTLTKNNPTPLTRGARIAVAIIFIAIAGIFYW
ncbi:MAG: hypothetical protein PHP82_03100 [Candidatus ainarchaeum sp.]|nr:hypothetical protein [Candidatus ainarchaeum sp.]